MEHDIKKFVDNISESAKGQLTDQLLSFTLISQQYLCLNIVRPTVWLEEFQVRLFQGVWKAPTHCC